MKKLLFMILFIISLFVLSCNHNKSNSSLTNPIGKVGEITVNPLDVTPLSAVYTTASVNAVPITVTVKGLYGEPDIIHTYPAGYATEFEIHGMFPESHNTIIVNDGGRTITKNIYIGTLSTSDNITIQKKYDVEINELNEEKYPNNPDLYIVMSSIGAGSILGISPKGYIRYFIKYYGSSLKIENKMLILHSNNSRNVISLIGKIIKTKPTNIHHDTI
ncbi:aryl-sulfate sulfotransferase N-terminal domain-containing protein [Brachyspira intermedia]|uniref:aryl-sulfate sulfotransferase N-terminal domain-containing protein n=1 Tax=Brachyspira intermedia TaxID=84377 RepID=UPI0030074595